MNGRATPGAPGNTDWWREGVVYQIYPRSFYDSDGDGVGDVPGIVAKLDYLEWLGIDAVWLSPIYRSPMLDYGYDISDHCDIDPQFGTLEDVDVLIAEAHRRNIRVVLDYVPNHTSDQHPWFIESRRSRDNPKRDWYWWRDGKPDGSPPNNWLSHFVGPAWTFDAATSQYYLHLFLPQQPDLNWNNPDVVEAMHGVLHFWLSRNVDGVRIDVIHALAKDAQLRDNPPHPDLDRLVALMGERAPRQLRLYSQNRPEVHGLIQGLRRTLDRYGAISVGEVYLLDVDELARYLGSGDDQLHLAFNFAFLHSPWQAAALRDVVERTEALFSPRHAWPTWTLSNHDNVRHASRYGEANLRAAALLLLTLRGTPFLYYGEELGTPDVTQATGHDIVNRDPSRAPLRWDASPRGGFTTGTPWLPLPPRQHNVADQSVDADSVLSFYRRALALRRDEPALRLGAYASRPAAHDVLTWSRGEAFDIALNTGDDDQPVALDGVVVLATERSREGDVVRGSTVLAPGEGVAVRRDG